MILVTLILSLLNTTCTVFGHCQNIFSLIVMPKFRLTCLVDMANVNRISL